MHVSLETTILENLIFKKIILKLLKSVFMLMFCLSLKKQKFFFFFV